jgi:hypothetical protein
MGDDEVWVPFFSAAFPERAARSLSVPYAPCLKCLGAFLGGGIASGHFSGVLRFPGIFLGSPCGVARGSFLRGTV